MPEQDKAPKQHGLELDGLGRKKSEDKMNPKIGIVTINAITLGHQRRIHGGLFCHHLDCKKPMEVGEQAYRRLVQENGRRTLVYYCIPCAKRIRLV